MPRHINCYCKWILYPHINLRERVWEFKVIWNGIRQNLNLNMTSFVTELLVHRQRSEPKWQTGRGTVGVSGSNELSVACSDVYWRKVVVTTCSVKQVSVLCHVCTNCEPFAHILHKPQILPDNFQTIRNIS